MKTQGGRKVLKGIAKGLLLLVALPVLFVVVFALAFFATPDFHLPTAQLRGWIEKFAPNSLAVKMTALEIEIKRPQDSFFAKRISIEAKDVCVVYADRAVNACLESFHLAFTGGWGGEVLPTESKWMPHLFSIEPIVILGVNADVDLAAFPKSAEESKSDFDLMGFLRKSVLPKWELRGSNIEVEKLRVLVDAETGYEAKFGLRPTGNLTDESGALEFTISDLHEIGGPLKAKMRLVIEPGDVTKIWKVAAQGRLELDRRRSLDFKSDANIKTFEELDLRFQTMARGIKPLKEARIEAAMKASDVSGKVSLKLGASGAEVRALDFVNCAWSANLDRKVGNLHCGPETVRLVVRERSFLRRPDLFVLYPQLDLNVKQILFGEEKGADIDFDLRLDHRQMAQLAIRADATVRKTPSKLTYKVLAQGDLKLPAFSRAVDLVRETQFAIPAPFNVLDGSIGLQTRVDFTEQGGAIEYALKTDLKSPDQRAALDLTGITKLSPQFRADTDATLTIHHLVLAAPRFDLRRPPALKPDSRFGPVRDARGVAGVAPPMGGAKDSNSHFRLHVVTSRPEAIAIALNLTQAPVPLSVDVVYDDRAKSELVVAPNAASTLRDRAASELRANQVKAKSPVTGSVVVGRTPINLFKRNAVLEEMRVDLLETGDNRLNGRLSVTYLEYAINVLVLGAISEPQLRFFSDPPLDDNQIVSVLLFGRPQSELGEEEKTSVASLGAAVTDAVLSVSSLYFLASTPVESVGYDSEKQQVTARVGLGGGTSVEFGRGAEGASGVGIRKRLSKDFLFRSDVETLGTTGKRTVSALIEWVKKF